MAAALISRGKSISPRSAVPHVVNVISRHDLAVLNGFLIMALGSLFFLYQDRRLRRGTTVDEINNNPYLAGYRLARPIGILLGAIAVIIAIVGFVRLIS